MLCGHPPGIRVRVRVRTWVRVRVRDRVRGRFRIRARACHLCIVSFSSSCTAASVPERFEVRRFGGVRGSALEVRMF
jgi:hypothetical protein